MSAWVGDHRRIEEAVCHGRLGKCQENEVSLAERRRVGGSRVYFTDNDRRRLEERLQVPLEWPHEVIVMDEEVGGVAYDGKHVAHSPAVTRPVVAAVVLADKKTLLPDPVGTIEATRELVKEGFTVLAYTSDDPRAAKALQDIIEQP